MKLRLVVLALGIVLVLSLVLSVQPTADTPACVDSIAALSSPYRPLSEPTISGLDHEVKFGDYTARSYLIAETKNIEATVGVLEIWKSSRLVCRQEGQDHRYSLYPEVKDYTGGGGPNLVIRDCVGIDRGPCWLYVFELGSTLRHVTTAYVPLDNEKLVDLDGESIPELVVYDVTFAYWKMPFGCSPFPKVILRFKDGAYHLASDLMQQPPPTEAELAQHAKRARNILESGAFDCSHELLGYMIDLIYAGHADLAWRFFDMAWPSDKSGKTKFLAEFMSQLASGQYWPELRKMNNFDFIDYLQDQN